MNTVIGFDEDVEFGEEMRLTPRRRQTHDDFWDFLAQNTRMRDWETIRSMAGGIGYTREDYFCEKWEVYITPEFFQDEKIDIRVFHYELGDVDMVLAMSVDWIMPDSSDTDLMLVAYHSVVRVMLELAVRLWIKL